MIAGDECSPYGRCSSWLRDPASGRCDLKESGMDDVVALDERPYPLIPGASRRDEGARPAALCGIRRLPTVHTWVMQEETRIAASVDDVCEEMGSSRHDVRVTWMGRPPRAFLHGGQLV